MLKKFRIICAAIFFFFITFLFLDFTGSLQSVFGWMVKLQFLPALMALNFFVVAGLILLTLIFGRIYCSVICPLGVMQDIIIKMSDEKKTLKLGYKKAHTKLRIFFFVIFTIFVCCGLFSVGMLIAPYSAYGRIASNLFAPLSASINNVFAFLAEKLDSYAFYNVEIAFNGFVGLGIALVSFAVIFALAWKFGRLYCNSVCPVGTFLGYLAKFSILKPVINLEKCNGCGLCARKCKANCINSKEHEIDYSRCVTCFDCISNCKQGAISYTFKRAKAEEKIEEISQKNSVQDNSRRGFFVSAMLLASSVIDTKKLKVDGGLEPLRKRNKAKRNFKILPAGAISTKNFSDKCTGCGLCVSACPTKILKPSSKLSTLLQPEISFEDGYCEITCNKCAEVCPAGAITPFDLVEKTSIQIGRAKFYADICVNNVDKLQCDNCFRQCPTGAIQMVHIDPKNPKSMCIPTVDENRCIGCGACENLCPARPLAAIRVEGNTVHKSI